MIGFETGEALVELREFSFEDQELSAEFSERVGFRSGFDWRLDDFALWRRFGFGWSAGWHKIGEIICFFLDVNVELR